LKTETNDRWHHSHSSTPSLAFFLVPTDPLHLAWSLPSTGSLDNKGGALHSSAGVTRIQYADHGPAGDGAAAPEAGFRFFFLLVNGKLGQPSHAAPRDDLQAGRPRGPRRSAVEHCAAVHGDPSRPGLGGCLRGAHGARLLAGRGGLPAPRA
jgi:hypothetical protein